MVSFFGLGAPKCAQCGMKLKLEEAYEWQDKKFCSKDCKRSYRTGNKGGSCH